MTWWIHDRNRLLHTWVFASYMHKRTLVTCPTTKWWFTVTSVVMVIPCLQTVLPVNYLHNVYVRHVDNHVCENWNIWWDTIPQSSKTKHHKTWYISPTISNKCDEISLVESLKDTKSDKSSSDEKNHIPLLFIWCCEVLWQTVSTTTVHSRSRHHTHTQGRWVLDCEAV